MPKAYWIAQVTVSNPDQYKLYAEGALAAFKKYDAKIPSPKPLCSSTLRTASACDQ